MIDKSKYSEAQESQRRFLFRSLSIVEDDNGGSGSGSDANEDQNQMRQRVAKSFDKSKQNNRGGDCRASRRYTGVKRISQLDTWDCGVACLLMIASWLSDGHSHDKKPFGGRNCYHDHCDLSCGSNSIGCQESSERKKILSDVGTESIWTSDLLLQLQSWKTNRTMATTPKVVERKFPKFYATSHVFIPPINGSGNHAFFFVLASQQVMGADESYRELAYYQNAFEEDRFRVARTFRNLHSQAVPMLQTTVFCDDHRAEKGMSLSTVIDIVEQDDCLAIVLLDNNCLLQRTTADIAESKSSAFTRSRHHPAPPYAGHYVILCGTSDHSSHVEIAYYRETKRGNDNQHSSAEGNKDDQRKKARFCFVLCNPDPSSTPSGSNYMFVTPELFEASWRAQGTDEDIIFLRKPQKPGHLKKPRFFGSLFLYEGMGDNKSNNENEGEREGEEEHDLRNTYSHRFSAMIRAFFEKIIFR